MDVIDPAILAEIEARLTATPAAEIPRLLRPLSLAAWGQLVLDVPAGCSNLQALIPPMPPDSVQDQWTGAHGEVLMGQSMAFVASLVDEYAALSGHDLERARVLDYGCGWGRHLRLLLKYVSATNLYGVDPWEEALALCRSHGVKAHLAQSQSAPETLPFERRFELIYAFSVFTHLDEATTHAALNTLRRYLSDDGVLVITLRPPEYWHFHRGGLDAAAMLAQHEQSGFAFTPHPVAPFTFGDTSISLEYLAQNFPDWKLASQRTNAIDPFQMLAFLRKA